MSIYTLPFINSPVKLNPGRAESVTAQPPEIMSAWSTLALTEMAEGLSFQGDSSLLNPMHYLPSPGHTKFWQERTPLAQYINNEVVGTRMRRWQRPIHDFVMPYLRGIEERTSGEIVIPQEVQRRRDLNTLADQVIPYVPLLRHLPIPIPGRGFQPNRHSRHNENIFRKISIQQS
jgi:hypothetical protein